MVCRAKTKIHLPSVYDRQSRDKLTFVNRRIALLPIAAFLLISCGGGGESAVRPQNSFRANNIGDSWNYDVSINFGQFGAYKGTIVEALTADTYSGQSTIRDTRTFYLTLKTGPATITSYSEISLKGVLLATMVNAKLYDVISDTFTVGRTIDGSTRTAGVITLSNGTTLTETYRVVGTEKVATKAGTFDCWVVAQTVISSDGTIDRFTMWVAPEIGGYVKISDRTVNPDGSGYTYVASLTSIVTPPPPKGVNPTPLARPSSFALPSFRTLRH